MIDGRAAASTVRFRNMYSAHLWRGPKKGGGSRRVKRNWERGGGSTEGSGVDNKIKGWFPKGRMRGPSMGCQTDVNQDQQKKQYK